MTYADIVLWALGLWGWVGMHITVEERHLGWGVSAVSYPAANFQTCRIIINLDDSLPERSVWTTVLHEVGHCVGYWPEYAGQSPHNQSEPSSVMWAPVTTDRVEITIADRERIKRIRDIKLLNRITVAEIAK